MSRSRLRPSLVALALVGALFAPTAGVACEARQHRCPGMPPELAALCHQAKTMAPDCCQHERQAPERRNGNELSAPALLAAATAAPATIEAASAAAPLVPGAGFSRDASFHELGLFTLHAVFRI
ncbi:MAG TPA: hypothetical protein VGC00_11415 [Thermoanaerobaculia bacterium]